MTDGKLRNMTGIYLQKGDRMLLLYRMGSKVIEDSYTGAAGGHFEREELNDARACVLRELYEETGLQEQDVDGLTLRYVTLRLKNGEIRQNYYFFAELKEGTKEPVSNEGRLQWFSQRELLEKNISMPHTARYTLRHYLKTGQYTKALYVGVATAEGVTFTEAEEFDV